MEDKKKEVIKISLSDKILHSDAMQAILAHRQLVMAIFFSLLLVAALGGYFYNRYAANQSKNIMEAIRLEEEITAGILPSKAAAKTYQDAAVELRKLANNNKEIKRLVSGILAEEALLQNRPKEASLFIAPTQKELIAQGLSPYASFSESVILLSEKKPREALQNFQKLIDSPTSSQYPLLKAYSMLHKIIALRSLNKMDEEKAAINDLRSYINSKESPLSEEQKNAFLQNIDFGSYSLLDFLEV